MLNKGISPVIATVILVAVALLLAVALTGWVMGIWGTIGATEAVQIVSASLSGNRLNLTIVNRGNVETTVVLISAENTTTTLNATSCTPTIPCSVKPGESLNFNCTLDSNASSGRVYTVKLATYGGTYTYDVRAKG
ncbi:MAG: archaellin/type IV pilin N-terminal domain-containing protein [Sulfolobales archaeon]